MKPKTQHSQAKPQKSQVRIIGGQHKRRLIEFVAVDGLRPTPDRLRETLFNWLMTELQEANVLDVCAGSGVLGFEAISRGASFATFIELNKLQASHLTQTANLLKSTNTKIINGDCLKVLPTLAAPFHIVFIDPPYSLNLWQAILDKLIIHQLINTETLLYIESDKPIETIIDTPIKVIKESRVGAVFAYLTQIT